MTSAALRLSLPALLALLAGATTASEVGTRNQKVTVNADQPFRLRLDVEQPGATAEDQLRLQYRRNGGSWAPVEAADFPYPQRKYKMDFASAEAGPAPAGWRAASGDGSGMTVVADSDRQVLRARAGATALIGLYPPPWELAEFALATEYRLPGGDRSTVGLVFGYVDAGNHWRVLLDAGSGSIRVSRLVDGTETIIAERSAGVIPGQWHAIEAKVEAGMLEVNFEDDALEFTVPVGSAIPVSALGFLVPAGGSVDFRRFVIEGEPITPPVSIVSTPGYQDGEFGWPLVIRRYADGAVSNETGDTFEFRITDRDGKPLANGPNPVLTLKVPAGHLGGTFVETPGRIGPWQARNGDLYFIMEPAESDNLFMMLKSTDGGRSWREVDGAGRPATGDLESVDGRQVEGTIHLIHQVTEATRYHSFRTSDHPNRPDSWAITDELATEVTALAQMASLVARPDGSLVTFHMGDTIGYSIRSPAGSWSKAIVIDFADGTPALAGPQAVLGADGTVHLAYYRMDGTIWYRRLLADGTLTKGRQLATGVGSSEDDFGAVLPLVYLPESDTVVIVYRLADGSLWERRVSGDALPTPAVQVTNRRVVQHPVDSQQAAADLVADGEDLHVLFIDEADRSIYSTQFKDGRWQPATLQVDGIQGTWVRGNVYARPDGVKVYGYVYDAGSTGGAGMNRFGELVLE